MLIGAASIFGHGDFALLLRLEIPYGIVVLQVLEQLLKAKVGHGGVQVDWVYLVYLRRSEAERNVIPPSLLCARTPYALPPLPPRQQQPKQASASPGASGTPLKRQPVCDKPP